MPDAMALALVYLNRRERTVSEVRARLERADLADSEIESTVAELVELGYLDDARFARLFVEDKRNLERWGSERIVRGLAAHGIDHDVIAQALAAAAGPGGKDGRDSELGRALELLERRFPQPPSEPRERERAFGVLIRKGYDSELAVDAIRAWCAAD